MICLNEINFYCAFGKTLVFVIVFHDLFKLIFFFQLYFYSSTLNKGGLILANQLSQANFTDILQHESDLNYPMHP